MPLIDAIGKGSGNRNPKSFTLAELEALGNTTFSQLPPSTQRWAEVQASQLHSGGTYGPAQQRQLEMRIGGMFSQAEQGRVLAAVRFLALLNSAGGNFARLQTQRGGLTPFQRQLFGGAQFGL